METKYKHTSELLAFFDFAQMKNLYRQGWLQNGISKSDCETDADHIFGVALMGYIIAREYHPDLDAKKVMELGLFHELGEVFVGDITPRDNVPTEKRKQMEFESIKKTFSKLPNPQKYIEYEKKESPEAKFVE